LHPAPLSSQAFFRFSQQLSCFFPLKENRLVSLQTCFEVLLEKLLKVAIGRKIGSGLN
jgi:hypothetical protein